MASTFLILSVISLFHQCQATLVENAREIETKDWWKTTIFYQIYPRSFSDSNGDGIGDLRGIIDNLDHLKDMGVGATWLSPVYKSPNFDFGYDVSDFYDIDPTYGTMADFEELVEKANELGIKIIMDFIPNHVSIECEWFRESLNKSSDKADWFIWEDPKGFDANVKPIPPNNWVSVFRFSAWEWSEDRQQFYLHQITKQQPDLNYRNPAVVEEMKNVLRFWLDKGIGGVRVSATTHLFEVNKEDFQGKYPDEPQTGDPNQGPDDYGYVNHIYTRDRPETFLMVYEWRKVLDEYGAKDNITRVMMSEAYTNIKHTMQYYGDDTSEGSHIPFNYGFIKEINSKSWAQEIKYLIDRWFTYMPMGKTANWLVGNHDQWRVATRFGNGRIDGSNMLVLLLPGVAVTYMGEEIGMENTLISWEDTKDPLACNTRDPINYWKSSRDAVRTPYQWNNSVNAGFSSGKKTWLPVNKNYLELNLAAQKKSNRSHYTIYKNVASLRCHPTFKYGHYQSLALTKEVFAFKRYLKGEDTFVVVMNLGASSTTVDLHHFDGLSDMVVVVEASVNSDKTIDSIVKSAELDLKPYESIVLKSSSNSLNITCLLI